MATSVRPARRDRPDGADLTVHHPARRDDVRAGIRLCHRKFDVKSIGGVIIDRPDSSRTPQCPWSVNSSRQVVGHQHGGVTEVGGQIAQRHVGMPSSAIRQIPMRPCPRCAAPRTASSPPTQVDRLGAALRSESRVC